MSVLVKVLDVLSNCEAVPLSEEIAFSDVDVLFCDNLAFIFIPILPFLTKVDEFFLLHDNPVFSDHNDALASFEDCPELS